jgi:hypothetical protein
VGSKLFGGGARTSGFSYHPITVYPYQLHDTEVHGYNGMSMINEIRRSLSIEFSNNNTKPLHVEDEQDDWGFSINSY